MASKEHITLVPSKIGKKNGRETGYLRRIDELKRSVLMSVDPLPEQRLTERRARRGL